MKQTENTACTDCKDDHKNTVFTKRNLTVSAPKEVNHRLKNVLEGLVMIVRLSTTKPLASPYRIGIIE